MNILVLTPFYSCEGYEDIWDIRYDPQGGMQLMISRLCKAIVKTNSNYKIDVVTMGQPNIPKYRKYKKNIDVYSYRFPIPKIKSKLGGYCGLIKSWAFSSFIHLLLSNKKYDVIFAHADGSGTSLLLYYMVSKIKHIPLILQVHSSRGATQTATTLWEILSDKPARKIEIKTVDLASVVYTLSNQTSKYFQSNLYNNKCIRKLVYLPNLEMFLSPSINKNLVLDIDTNKTNILYLGRVSSEKGCEIMVEIAKKVNRQHYHFIICGDGPELDNIKHLVKKWELNSAFSFLGFMPHSIIPQVISQCDIGVVPSEYEELGLVILEMMATKLPVISNDLSTVRQLITDKKNGLLVEKGNVNSWVKAIKLLSSDTNLRCEIINNAYNKAKEITSINSVAKTIIADMESVVKDAKRNKIH